MSIVINRPTQLLPVFMPPTYFKEKSIRSLLYVLHYEIVSLLHHFNTEKTKTEPVEASFWYFPCYTRKLYTHSKCFLILLW